MQTLIVIILILVLLTGTGYFGHRTNGVRGLIIALVIALMVLAVIGFVSDEIIVGPGVPPIIEGGNN